MAMLHGVVLFGICLVIFIQGAPVQDAVESNPVPNVDANNPGYDFHETLDTVLTKVEQHDLEIEQLQQEIRQIGDVLEKQYFIIGKLQDLMQIEMEDPGYQDDPGMEQVNADVVNGNNPPPMGTEHPPAVLKQSIVDTQNDLKNTKQSVEELETAHHPQQGTDQGGPSGTQGIVPNDEEDDAMNMIPSN